MGKMIRSEFAQPVTWNVDAQLTRLLGHPAWYYCPSRGSV
jgi:hypothetical protein